MTAKPPPPLPPEVQAAFERGQPIEAIKLLLQRRAAGPRRPSAPGATPTATPAARPPAAAPPSSTLPAQHGSDGLSPGEVPRSESAFWAWLVAGLFAYLAYRLWGG